VAQGEDRGAYLVAQEGEKPLILAAGELGALEREYLTSVKDEIVWVPREE
jgi:hypothetical protein